MFFIIISVVYSVFYISFNLTDNNNLVNSEFRLKFIQNHQLRNIFRLRQIGDARYDYKNNAQFPKLSINTYSQEGYELSKETLPLVINEMKRVIDKTDIEIFNDPDQLSVGNEVDDNKIADLIKSYPAEFSSSTKTAPVNIFILSRYSPAPSLIGIVKNDSSIFIFMDPVQNVSDRQKTTTNTEVSTVLHEFAHLLGANHITEDDCILSEKVENLTVNLTPSIITGSYCQKDIEEIQNSFNQEY